ncbi:unnamed protein product [Blepharisma stoltei]|uniref:Uncharacterized protein n=1 Tax=Blepharisma stoltei TaxID=1481888 RepID=A0AAU9K2S7_9CILI|nr:unnamed protein product [Blepharisma stoltei]
MEDPLELPEQAEQAEEVLRITVNIGNASDEIVVHADDEPIQLAREFAVKHNLNLDKCTKLAAHIENCIESLIEEETETKTPQKSIQQPESSTQSIRNIGEELYKKGIAQKSKLVSLMQQEKLKEMAKESLELTFRPVIHHYSPKPNLNVSSNSKEPKKHRPSLRSEDQDCTFKPKVNSRSEKLINSKSQKNIKPKHEELYDQAKILEIKKKQLEEYYLSKPKENPITIDHAREVADRLIQFGKTVDFKIEQLKKYEEENMKDPVSGRPFFSPKTCKMPETPRKLNIAGKNKLYKQKFDLENQTPRGSLTNNRSQKLIQKTKHHRWIEIFKLLNPSENDRIRSDLVDKDKIDPDLYKILSPFLEELAEIPDGLSFNDFCVAMENLMTILSQDEKSKLLNTSKKRKQSPQPYTFQPAINSSPGHSREGSIYERCYDMTQNRQEKISKARETRIQLETKNCTFKPKTTPYKATRSITKKYYEMHHELSHPCIGLCNGAHI